jgi:chorismate-pyruvate lyase
MALRLDEDTLGVGLPLSRFQRILLTTDGTVTHILEACAGERIRVVKLEHSAMTARLDNPALEMFAPEAVILRRILLQGMDSGQNYLYADSVMLVDRLAPALAEALVATDEPVGRLMYDRRLETFREVLSCGQEPAGACSLHFDIDPASPLLVRTYRVMASGRPVMVITEKFPSTFWLEGSEHR